MRKIALALVLFQLIGCAKQPVVITHPENKQETLQHDTPQAPKTNYLKIGAYIVGIILASLAIGRVILYCCTEPITKEDAQDIGRIVPKAALEIRSNYPAIEVFLLTTYTDHPKYKGNPELGAILKWHFLQRSETWDTRLGETYLSYQRKYVKTELDKEVEQEREEDAAESSISTLVTNIESSRGCIIQITKSNMTKYYQAVQEGTLESSEAPHVMNNIARIIYYYEFKEALTRNE